MFNYFYFLSSSPPSFCHSLMLFSHLAGLPVLDEHIMMMKLLILVIWWRFYSRGDKGKLPIDEEAWLWKFLENPKVSWKVRKSHKYITRFWKSEKNSNETVILSPLSFCFRDIGFFDAQRGEVEEELRILVKIETRVRSVCLCRRATHWGREKPPPATDTNPYISPSTKYKWENVYKPYTHT